MDNKPGFLEPHGYRKMFAYQKAEIIYDLTYHFCARFLKRGDRTIDQMVQAARSGKQNIIEGSKASATSKEMEIKLTNVARASLEELLADYEDYLRVHDLRKWGKNSTEALYIRKLPHSIEESRPTYRLIWETRSAEAVANVALCLINQANYLLDRHVRKLEQDFLKHGGVRERMTRARLQHR
jgi:four helix bundle suffix protein